MDHSRTGILIVGHGSPLPEANHTLKRVADELGKWYPLVQPAFLQFERPNLSEALDLLVERGARKIIVHPYFLYRGAHVSKDIPSEIEEARKRYPDLEVTFSSHLGFHEKLVEVAQERIEEAIGNSRKEGIHPIEEESFRIIDEVVDLSRFTPQERPIVKRVIHATGDPEYADLIAFGRGAIEAGLTAIMEGVDVITDVRMVEVGINTRRLSRFGGRVRCFISHREVMERWMDYGPTRASAAMRMAGPYLEGSIVAIGNAPTALMELIRMIREGVRPALVVGTPVGFVDAEEAKERLMELSVPYISVRGRKGGSPVAVAIVNALLIIAERSCSGRLSVQENP